MLNKITSVDFTGGDRPNCPIWNRPCSLMSLSGREQNE